MARTLKPETQIKKIMESFINSNGMKDADITINNTRYFLVAPNHFGQGYIKYISDGEVWSAALKKSDPTKVTCVKLVKGLSEEERHEAALNRGRLAALNERLNDPYLYKGSLGEQILLKQKQHTLDWFASHYIQVQA